MTPTAEPHTAAAPPPSVKSPLAAAARAFAEEHPAHAAAIDTLFSGDEFSGHSGPVTLVVLGPAAAVDAAMRNFTLAGSSSSSAAAADDSSAVAVISALALQGLPAATTTRLLRDAVAWHLRTHAAGAVVLPRAEQLLASAAEVFHTCWEGGHVATGDLSVAGPCRDATFVLGVALPDPDDAQDAPTATDVSAVSAASARAVLAELVHGALGGAAQEHQAAAFVRRIRAVVVVQ